ncbi:multidrug transporter subunit MdtD [Aeromonas simiae]|uniref:multidrug transporter subunit MdtD n=1 Tax=Aeromonas simiae TaxID=218936 RepID=UPI0005A98140|nr:multidrug transporter subunit MdtD [Aeromonas simiae]MDO2949984.1 multidrug transporter subunit MdtD [Aeromonas simiae]MDO2953271.1 multidrug transporter subunit MdtD [Aeromonas simiae]MDO2957373.1 multidrug transporter subunit MdtD [Aeromonas simiae]
MLTPFERKLLPWLAAVGFFMQALDATILNTALPAMAASLGESPLRMQSVIIAYVLTVALLIPASGWLADRFGTRRIYLLAILLFTLGSLACAAAPSLPLLVTARVLQGIGGALLVPVGRLAVLRIFQGRELLRAMSFVTIPGLVGPLIGPALGGWLVEVASWHWVFLINLPVGLLGLLVCGRFMPDLYQPTSGFDWKGFALFSLGLVLASLGLQGMGERSFSVGISLLMLLAGLAAMAGYWLYAARATRPLFSLSLFHSSTFAIGILGNLFARLGSGAMPFLTPLFLQLGLGFSPSVAGMTMIPTVLGAMLTKTLVNRLIPMLGYRRILIGNTLLLGGMMSGFAFIDAGLPYWALLCWLGLFGAFNSLQFSAMNTLTLKDLGPEQASGGNSLLSVVMQLAMSMGIAIAASLLNLFHGEQETWLPTFHITYVAVGVMSMLAALIFAQLGQEECEPTPRRDASAP